MIKHPFPYYFLGKNKMHCILFETLSAHSTIHVKEGSPPFSLTSCKNVNIKEAEGVDHIISLAHIHANLMNRT